MNRTTSLTLILLLLVSLNLFAQELLLSEEGQIESGDSRYDNRRIIDWYDITVPSGSRVVARAVSADFTPVVVLDGPEGLIENGGGRYGAEAATQYRQGERIRVGVTTTDEEPGARGVYSLRVRLFETGPTLRAGSVEEGTLDQQDEHLADQRAIDWYPLEVESGQRIFIEMDSFALDTYLIIRYPDGTESFNDDFQSSNAAINITATENMLLQLGATTFSRNSYGDYTLIIQASEPPQEVRVGQTLRGSLGSDGGGSFNLYSLYGEPGEIIEVELSSNDFDTYLILREPGGHTVQNDDYGPATDSRLVYVFNSDAPVEIEVTSFGGGVGSYQLSVTEFAVEGEIEEVVPGRLITSGEEVTALLNRELEGLGGDIGQLFTIRAEANNRIILSLSSDFFDTYLYLVSPSGEEYSNDDGLTGTNSLLDVIAPESGTYEVLVTSYSGTSTGLYTISYREGGEVRILARFRDVLDSTAPRDVAGRLFRRHSFDATAGQYLTIDLVSDEFDTYLTLEGPEGFVISENDDYGPNTDSRIVQELNQTGRYTAIVSGFWEDSEGAYELIVSE